MRSTHQNTLYLQQWRKKNRTKYREYMRSYMVQWRLRKALSLNANAEKGSQEGCTK